MKRLQISIFAALFLLFFLPFFVLYAYAAEPQFLITWKAQTKVPVWYTGKALPVQNSVVLVSVSLLEQTGKLADLSGSEIRWYLKGDLVQKGVGITSLSVMNRDFSGNDIDLRASVQYSDADGTRFVDTYRTIPVVDPEAVIEYKNLQPFFSAGSDVAVKGYPFYFTNSFLKSEWDISNAQKVQDVYDLKIESAPQGLRSLKFSVWNPSRVTEKAQKTLQLQAN